MSQPHDDHPEADFFDRFLDLELELRLAVYDPELPEEDYDSLAEPFFAALVLPLHATFNELKHHSPNADRCALAKDQHRRRRVWLQERYEDPEVQAYFLKHIGVRGPIWAFTTGGHTQVDAGWVSMRWWVARVESGALQIVTYRRNTDFDSPSFEKPPVAYEEGDFRDLGRLAQRERREAPEDPRLRAWWDGLKEPA